MTMAHTIVVKISDHESMDWISCNVLTSPVDVVTAATIVHYHDGYQVDHIRDACGGRLDWQDARYRAARDAVLDDIVNGRICDCPQCRNLRRIAAAR